MDGNRRQLVAHERDRAVVGAEHHPVAGIGEVCGGQRGAAGPDGGHRRLINQVGQIRPREPRGSRGDLLEVDAGFQALAAGVDGEDGAPLGPVGQRDDDFAVEPAWAAQRRVQGARAVGRGEHYHAVGLVEAVHLGEELVEGLLSFVAANEAFASAAGAEGVDLVDEHDRRRAGAGLLEQVPYPGGTDAHEHLHET